jgi:hypothetical protein
VTTSSSLVKALHGYLQISCKAAASRVELLQALESCRMLSKSVVRRLCESETIVKLRRF